jgi:hypothetical protein
MSTSAMKKHEQLASAPKARSKSKAALAREKRGYAYLTTERLISEAQKAGKEAAAKSMEVMGYIMISQDGWVVKQFKDGTIEKVEEL